MHKDVRSDFRVTAKSKRLRWARQWWDNKNKERNIKRAQKDDIKINIIQICHEKNKCVEKTLILKEVDFSISYVDPFVSATTVMLRLSQGLAG